MEHQIYQFTDDEVQMQFDELLKFGVMIGSEGIASHLKKKK